MADDMSELINNFSNMLKEDKLPGDIKNMLNNVMSNKENDTTNNEASSKGASPNIDPEMLSNLANMFNSKPNSNNDSNNSNSSVPNIDMDTILKMKTIMDKMNNTRDDPRSNLLQSLKPYLKDSRKGKVEQYMQLFNMTKVLDVFTNMGGDKKK